MRSAGSWFGTPALTFDADLTACAEIVQSGDPDRFAAVMASPVAARRMLFPLYAFNVEVSRAPWVTQEPMIAEMRLQWWRDAVEEIGLRKPVRRHPVVTPLALVANPQDVAVLDRLIAARRWDIYKDAFEDAAHFARYLSQTAGGLMWAAAQALGAQDTQKDIVMRFGAATGLARYLQAVPELEARGRIPLLDGRAEALRDLAQSALDTLPTRSSLIRSLPKPARPAVTEGWMTQAILKQVVRDPGRVGQGALGHSPFRQRLSLIRWA
ncbi:MAG: squalene/phytoene synthase family protein [Sulfitobacter sp.]